MNKIPTAILKLFRTNPPGIALLLIAGRSWSRMTSSVMAFLLKAPGLQLGPGCRIIGGHHISFGREVYAGRDLWLEAVTSYRSQRFHPEIAIGDHVCFSDGVHISSIAGLVAGGGIAYSASKGGMIAMTKAQAFEYGPSPAYMSESKSLDELRGVDARKCVDLRLKRCVGLQLGNYDGLICTSSKQVTESAFVHSPGRPAAYASSDASTTSRPSRKPRN